MRQSGVSPVTFQDKICLANLQQVENYKTPDWDNRLDSTRVEAWLATCVLGYI